MIKEQSFTLKESWFASIVLIILIVILCTFLCSLVTIPGDIKVNIILAVCFSPFLVLGILIIYFLIKNGTERIVFLDNDLLIEKRKLLVPWSDLVSLTIFLKYNTGTRSRNIFLMVKTNNDEEYVLQTKKKQPKYARKLLNIKQSKYAEFGLLVANLYNYNCTIEEALELFLNKNPNIQVLVYQSGFSAMLEDHERAYIDSLVESTSASIAIYPL